MQPRYDIKQFTDIPNVGPATERDFILLGLTTPQELIDKDPYQLYFDLCDKTGMQQDLCVIDVFIAAVRFMQGETPHDWWYYTPERKAHFQKIFK